MKPWARQTGGTRARRWATLGALFATAALVFAAPIHFILVPHHVDAHSAHGHAGAACGHVAHGAHGAADAHPGAHDHGHARDHAHAPDNDDDGPTPDGETPTAPCGAVLLLTSGGLTPDVAVALAEPLTYDVLHVLRTSSADHPGPISLLFVAPSHSPPRPLA